MNTTTPGHGDGRGDQHQAKPAPPPRPAGPVSPPASMGPSRGGQGGRSSDPVFPFERVKVTAWADPVLDRLGHDPRSGYVEQYWLSLLGPSCLLLLRRLAAEIERSPDGFELDTVQWASEMGIGMKGGKNGPFWRAIERGCRFGAARRNGDRLAIRRRLPPLTARQVERLPPQLRLAHERWVEARLDQPRRPTVVRWSPDNHRSAQTPADSVRTDHARPLDDAA